MNTSHPSIDFRMVSFVLIRVHGRPDLVVGSQEELDRWATSAPLPDEFDLFLYPLVKPIRHHYSRNNSPDL